MATNAPLVFNWGSLPPGYAPANWQDLVNKLSTLLTGYLEGTYSTFSVGNTTPTTTDQDKPWMRLNVDGSPDKWFVYYNGLWVSKHPVPASGDERRLWVGDTTTIHSYDGGDGTPSTPTSTTGAMWAIDSDNPAKFLCTPGAFDSSGTLAVDGTATDTGVSGEDKHTLLTTEIGSFTIRGTINPRDGSSDNTIDALYVNDNAVTSTNQSVYPQGAAAHNNLPPMYGVYLIKRTARVYYTVS